MTHFSFCLASAGAFSTPPTSPKSYVPSQAHSTPDVQVSRFDRDETTSRAAFARSQLAKRLLVNQAQQRPIPIQSLSNTANHDLASNSDQQTATSLAATVAASVAVSVAQPFLKLQNELEHKMNSVLDQIQQQQKRALGTGLTVPVTTVAQASTRSEECANNRMKYMEKVQEKQQQVLQQLVDMVHTTKPKSKSPKPRRKTFAEVNGKYKPAENDV
jgi:predicted RND superfamily exporter protein